MYFNFLSQVLSGDTTQVSALFTGEWDAELISCFRGGSPSSRGMRDAEVTGTTKEKGPGETGGGEAVQCSGTPWPCRAVAPSGLEGYYTRVVDAPSPCPRASRMVGWSDDICGMFPAAPGEGRG